MKKLLYILLSIITLSGCCDFYGRLPHVVKKIEVINEWCWDYTIYTVDGNDEYDKWVLRDDAHKFSIGDTIKISK